MSTSSSISLAMYRPHEGKKAELMEILKSHYPTLRAEGLVTDRQPLILESTDGTLIEIFEWASDEAKDLAHRHPAVQVLWEKMMPIADFPSLSELPEAGKRFPNFNLA